MSRIETSAMPSRCLTRRRGRQDRHAAAHRDQARHADVGRVAVVGGATGEVPGLGSWILVDVVLNVQARPCAVDGQLKDRRVGAGRPGESTASAARRRRVRRIRQRPRLDLGDADLALADGRRQLAALQAQGVGRRSPPPAAGASTLALSLAAICSRSATLATSF